MVTQRGFDYKGHRLLCEPMKTSSGRYAPRIVIAKDGNEVHRREFPAGEEFATEGEAIEHSRMYGTVWVDEHPT